MIIHQASKQPAKFDWALAQTISLLHQKHKHTHTTHLASASLIASCQLKLNWITIIIIILLLLLCQHQASSFSTRTRSLRPESLDWLTSEKGAWLIDLYRAPNRAKGLPLFRWWWCWWCWWRLKHKLVTLNWTLCLLAVYFCVCVRAHHCWTLCRIRQMAPAERRIKPTVRSLALTFFYFATFFCNHQVSLTISIVLSVDVFLLCLIEIIPPTSFVVPLLGQYLLFTLTLVTVSVVATVWVLNISFRNASSHKMSNWERRLYLDLLPTLLFMKKRDDTNCDEVSKTKLIHCGSNNKTKQCTCPVESSTSFQRANNHSGNRSLAAIKDKDEQVISLCELRQNEIKNAFLSLDFVAKRLENRENHNKVSRVIIIINNTQV